MKILIEIPEHVYEHAKESSEDSRDEFDAMRAIANGTQQESSSEIPNTCDDAISRQAVLDLMRGLTRWCVRSEDGKWNNVGLLYDDVMFGIDRLPSVTPQQRTGRWKFTVYDANSIGHYECTECHWNVLMNVSDYCPHCGAKMEVEE